MEITLDEILAIDPATREKTQQYRLILRHALVHFSKRGYAGTNVRAIAADAAASAPMINYYFQTKEALHNEVVRIVMARLDNLVWSNFPSTAAFELQARHLADRHARFAKDYRDALGLILGLVYGPPEGRPSVDLYELYGPTIRGTRRVVEAAVADGRLTLRPNISIDTAVTALEDAVNRVAIRCWQDPEVDESRLIDDTIGTMLGGVQAPLP
jgi:AcrR family transcriptional regulator